jgi:hypothetical protein
MAFRLIPFLSSSCIVGRDTAVIQRSFPEFASFLNSQEITGRGRTAALDGVGWFPLLPLSVAPLPESDRTGLFAGGSLVHPKGVIESFTADLLRCKR